MMKPKSFKKKGATGDRIEHHPIDPIAVDHHNYPIAQITVDSKQQYNPRQLAYNTKSSVTSGLEIDVWMSADGAYLLDLDPAELANVESVGHSSTQRVIDEEPQSEVKGEKFAQILD